MTKAVRHDRAGLVALCGALLILTIFALIDAYAVRGCFLLAHAQIGLPEVCTPEHMFRSTIEIGGMAVGLYGAGRLIRS